jgi:hypothetical protein
VPAMATPIDKTAKNTEAGASTRNTSALLMESSFGLLTA